MLCTGDMFIWASPNCGNPQKAQRYPREWAAALRDMANLQPRTLLPGHGPPILGEDRVAQALDETARLLETLVEQTVAAMNGGATLDDVLHSVKAPEELLARPYLRPVYDQPEFIVRNIWRLYGGWYDGDPSELEPAPRAALAEELVAFAGGTASMVDRALALSEQGEHRLACHLVELAWRVGKSDAAVAEARRQVYTARAEQAGSVMARRNLRSRGRGVQERTLTAARSRRLSLLPEQRQGCLGQLVGLGQHRGASLRHESDCEPAPRSSRATSTSRIRELAATTFSSSVRRFEIVMSSRFW